MLVGRSLCFVFGTLGEYVACSTTLEVYNIYVWR